VPIKYRPPEQHVGPAASIVGPDAMALVRFGLRAPDDPHILNTVRAIDTLLKVETPSGPVWRRYSDDLYGEHQDGAPFDGTGIGRAWPLLTGERAHDELAAGKRDVAEELVGELQIGPFVAEVHTVHTATEEKFVPEVAALMEQARERGEVLITIGAQGSDEVISVDEILGDGVKIKERKDTDLNPDFPPSVVELVSIYAQAFPEAHRGNVFQALVIEIRLIGEGKMGPPWIGNQRFEQKFLAREQPSPQFV
jgi:hypothetical protein